MTSGSDIPVRLDILLVNRGLARTRNVAQDLVRQGRVLVGGSVCNQASTPLPSDADLAIKLGRDFVSRGGRKLDAALDTLGVQVEGLVVADIGLPRVASPTASFSVVPDA